MDIIGKIIDFVIHLDRHLGSLIQTYGFWTYFLLFFVIFLETGFVVTPFLPGDSLLFAAGAFAAIGALNPLILFILLGLAAILGDTANYWIGHFLGPKVFQRENSLIFRREYLDRTHEFYEKYGAETIIIARFVPIVRTFAPFVAGIGRMSYGRFLSYNVIGGLMWVAVFISGGYFFGNISFIRRHFSLVILAIIIISLLPALVEVWRQKKKKRLAAQEKPGSNFSQKEGSR
jgi:membrane-associated protein